MNAISPGGLLMLIEAPCRRCGAAYVPTREDLTYGPETYHRCPDCRAGDVTAPSVNTVATTEKPEVRS